MSGLPSFDLTRPVTVRLGRAGPSRALMLGCALAAGLAGATVAGVDPLSPIRIAVDAVDVTGLESGYEIGSRIAQGAPPVCFERADAPALPGAAASVYLLTEYEDGKTLVGTGTIVRGSGSSFGEADRILTAGHVASPILHAKDGTSTRLAEIVAFSPTGHMLARLENLEVADRNAMDLTDSPSDDVQVLRVADFSSLSAEAYWAHFGAPLAPVQSTLLSYVSQDPGSALIAEGLSGSAVFDAEGRIMGVVMMSLHDEDNEIRAIPESGYSELATRANPEAAAAFPELLPTVTAPAPVDAIAVAIPVRHAEILAALGVGAGALSWEPKSRGEAVRGHLAGYPSGECTQFRVDVSDSLIPARTFFENGSMIAEALIGEIFDESGPVLASR